MSYKYDFLLRNGMVVDPFAKLEGVMDVGIKAGSIAEISPELNPDYAQESIDLKGLYILPGIIDMHAHISSWAGGKAGHKMMALAGVTTAVDMSGPIESVLDMAGDYGVGLNIACNEHIRPGKNVAGENPSPREIETLLEESLEKGAIGLKILGGHHPLTPEASAAAIEVANRNKAYIAFHAGTTKMGPNIEGFLEAVKLAKGNFLHLAHINSYCRGLVRPCLEETMEAVRSLEENPNIISESYLSPVNGASAKCVDGVPKSRQTQRFLKAGGYAPTEQGLKEAILTGWAQINAEMGGVITLITGKEGLEYWQRKNTDTSISFPVNPPEPRYVLATAKRRAGGFLVDAISTDGGGIPKNVIVEMGLSLVKLQALTMREFVLKTSTNPAKILGLKNKGYLSIGADADITVVDLDKQKAVLSMVGGELIMYRGYVFGRGSQIITTKFGERYVKYKGLRTIITDISNSDFYKGGFRSIASKSISPGHVCLSQG
jgi:hypothetical protein